MSAVPSEVSKYMGNAVKLADIWGTIIYNVKSQPYRAKGDGVTDDTIAIQSAIDAASAAGGGTVLFPTGTYCCWNLVMKANVLLTGNKGVTLKRINNASQLHWITAASITNFGIMNIILDGNKSLTPIYAYTDTLSFISSGQFEVEGVTIKNSVNRGIYIEKNTDITEQTRSQITKCKVSGSGSVNIWLRNCSDIDIDHNVSTTGGHGLVVEYTIDRYTSGNNLTISNNDCFDNTEQGIWCFSDANDVDRNNPMAKLLINNNRVHDNGLNGIASEINETILTDNDCYNNSATGIMLNTSNCIISGGSLSYNLGTGIDLGDCYRTIVEGVLIEENGVMGIEVNSCEDILIDTCIIRNNNSTNGGAAFGSNNGIYIYQGTDGGGNPFVGNSKNVTVKNCIIRRKVGYFQAVGIRVGNTAERVLLIGNDAYDSGNTDDFKIETITCFMEKNISKLNDYNHTQANLVSADTMFIPPDGDVFFIDGTATIANIITSGFGTATLPAWKGRKITVILNSASITLFAGNGTTTGNLLNNGDTNISGFLKIIEYICIGGSWLQFSASAGR